MISVLTPADERKLVGLNKDLVAVVRLVALRSPMPFIVTEGLRTKARQRELFRQGKTKTLNSQHILGRAVDVAPLVDRKVSWEWQHFTPLTDCAKECALHLGIPMTFGYDWGWDAPHWELKQNVGR